MERQQRAKDARARTLAEKTEKEATAAHATATEAATTECSAGPPGKNRGGKCLEAEGKRDAAQIRLDAARGVLLKAPVKETDPLAERIAAYTGDRITEEQVRLYRPLFLPLVLSILAGVFLSLGAHMDLPAAAPSSPLPRISFSWLRLPRQRRHAAAAPAIVPPPTEAPADPVPPDSKVLAAAATQPVLVVDHVKAGSVPKILTELLLPAKGRRVEIGKVFEGYAAACEAEGLRALTPDQFIEPTQRLCQECSIQTRLVGKRIYLLDVQLSTSPAASVQTA